VRTLENQSPVQRQRGKGKGSKRKSSISAKFIKRSTFASHETKTQEESSQGAVGKEGKKYQVIPLYEGFDQRENFSLG